MCWDLQCWLEEMLSMSNRSTLQCHNLKMLTQPQNLPQRHNPKPVHKPMRPHPMPLIPKILQLHPILHPPVQYHNPFLQLHHKKMRTNPNNMPHRHCIQFYNIKMLSNTLSCWSSIQC